MRESYDFSKAERNPYANRLKKQITIRVDVEVLDYFRELSRQLGIPYQTVMNLYLRDCASSKLRPPMNWNAEPELPRGRQIESDTKAGKLDSLADRALRDHAAGRSTKL